MHHHRKKRTKKIFRAAVLGGAGAVFLAGAIALLWTSSLKLPDLAAFETRKVEQSTKIYDRTGTVELYDVHDTIRRTIVDKGAISRNVKNATVAIEDDTFYQHRGIKISAIFRAVLADIRGGGYTQGGSTITQQVVKNALLTTDKTISRKIKEWALALKLEKVLDKDTILSIYLNDAPYGGSVYGIEEASETYFGKKASDITITESAYLAALPNAPTFYSPYGNNRKALDDRKNLVLRRMRENNFITEDEYRSALKETPLWKPAEKMGIKAPHFVIFIKQLLEEKYGAQAISSDGLRVTTTLDYKLQENAEATVKKWALINKDKYNASNAAMVALDPKNGQILAMVGSRDYFDKKIDGNFNVALARRQPGSSFKPFVYAEAFIKGYTPDTVLFDTPTEFSSECNPDGTPIVTGDEEKCYKPENFDGKYLGPMSLRNALAQSRNIPAIKTLYLAGLRDSLQLAKDMGVSSLGSSDDYGLTLVLGGGEVSLLDMASAYGVFASGGVRNPYEGILRVEDKNGAVLYSATQSPTRIIPEDIALTISSILSDEKAREPEFGSHSYLYVPGRAVAVKTGTTNDYRDAWILGYTPQIVIGAWAGNNDNSPMEKKIAGFIVAPMWNEYVVNTLKTLPLEDFKKPAESDGMSLKPALRGLWQGNTLYTVDKMSGLLATVNTPPELREDRVVREVHSILHWVDKTDPRGPPLPNPDIDPQYKLWEYGIQQWVKDNGIVNETNAVIPTGADSVHRPEYAPQIQITNPLPTASYHKTTRVAVTIRSASPYPLSRVDYYLNNTFIGSAKIAPFSFSFVPNEIDGLETHNDLRVTAYDIYLNKGETTTTLTVLP